MVPWNIFYQKTVIDIFEVSLKKQNHQTSICSLTLALASTLLRSSVCGWRGLFCFFRFFNFYMFLSSFSVFFRRNNYTFCFLFFPRKLLYFVCLRYRFRYLFSFLCTWPRVLWLFLRLCWFNTERKTLLNCRGTDCFSETTQTSKVKIPKHANGLVTTTYNTNSQGSHANSNHFVPSFHWMRIELKRDRLFVFY